MNSKDGFVRVAIRYLSASQAALAANIREASAFCAYHAFESVGGAVCSVRNRKYSVRSHRKKMNQFQAASNAFPFSHAVARVVVLVASVRNEALYPELLPDGSVTLPESTFSQTEAATLLHRVRGVVLSIISQI